MGIFATNRNKCDCLKAIFVARNGIFCIEILSIHSRTHWPLLNQVITPESDRFYRQKGELDVAFSPCKSDSWFNFSGRILKTKRWIVRVTSAWDPLPYLQQLSFQDSPNDVILEQPLFIASPCVPFWCWKIIYCGKDVYRIFVIAALAWKKTSDPRDSRINNSLAQRFHSKIKHLTWTFLDKRWLIRNLWNIWVKKSITKSLAIGSYGKPSPISSGTAVPESLFARHCGLKLKLHIIHVNHTVTIMERSCLHHPMGLAKLCWLWNVSNMASIKNACVWGEVKSKQMGLWQGCHQR